MKDVAKKHWAPIVVGVLFFLAFVFVTIRFLFQAQKLNDYLIADHIYQLDNIFSKINESCQIAGFKHQVDHVDFLTVKNFEGNTVGSMILVNPKNWAGPYLKSNLTIEGKEYRVVRTKKGYYIVPGNGVKLSNGIILGENLKINEDIDVENLIKDPKFLMAPNGKPLAAHIEVAENPFKKPNDDLIAEQIAKLGAIFRRINQSCQITGFRHQKDHIDFLNVKSFDGSIVGSMNLANPKGWEGPYLERNFTVEDKFYQVVSTKKGYYIIPDDGIDLSNGQILGQTLIINKDSDIEELLKNPKGLLSNGKQLAAKIETVKDLPGNLLESELFEED